MYELYHEIKFLVFSQLPVHYKLHMNQFLGPNQGLNDGAAEKT